MTDSRRRPAIYALFFVSGAAGLVYQVVWFRLLNEIFGVTVYAVTTVLATFLGGLALGSLVLGRVADRRANALRFYGLMELGIAASALAGSWLIEAFEPLHLFAAIRYSPDSLALIGVRVLLAAAVILPPTFLMGGTLPTMTRAIVTRMPRLGRELGALYALNTFGAVAGNLAAGFVLIGALGLHPTLWLAVAANLAVGAAALWLARGSATAPASEDADAGAPKETASAAGRRLRAAAGPPPPAAAVGRGLLVVMATSGFASLSLEVFWTRQLVLIVGTSAYAFVSMLSAFLVGIAFGSFIARLAVDRLRDPRRAFGWLQVAIAGATLATIPLMAAIMRPAHDWATKPLFGWLESVLGSFGTSFLIMIVPTTLIGMTFPLAGKMWTRRASKLGGQLGQVYGANTIGNIAGAVVSGFALLPALGMQKGIASICILNLACAAWGLWPAPAQRRRTRLLGAAPVAAGLAVCAVLLAARRPAMFTRVEEEPGDRVLYYKEGLVATVKVIQSHKDPRQRMMFVDGVRIGQSLTGVDRKQQVLAHIPFLLGPQQAPARVLSIGLGSGILVGETARHPSVRSLDCVELSPSVIEAARQFEAYNHDVLDDPKVHVINDDGVAFLRRIQTEYDAIISDGKSRKGHAGNAAFFSVDYYRLALDHLAPHGTMIQWVPLEVPGEEARTITRTFMSVFPHGYLWLGYGSWFLVGSRAPLQLDLAHIQRELDAPATVNLRRHGWRDAHDVASTLLADKATLAHYLAAEDTINSLEHPVLEFYSRRGTRVPDRQRVAENLADLGALARRQPPEDLTVVGGDEARLSRDRQAVISLVEGLGMLGPGDEARKLAGVERLRRARAEAPDHGVIGLATALALFDLGLAADRAGHPADATGWYAEALGAWPGLIEARYDLARLLFLQGRFREAIDHLGRVLEDNPRFGAAQLMLGKALQAIGKPAEAIAPLRAAVRLAPSPAGALGVSLATTGQLDIARAEAHNALGLSLAMTGQLDVALAELREAMRLAPDWPVAMSKLAVLLATHPDPRARNPAEAIRLGERAALLSERRDPLILETLAAAYASAGRFAEAATVQQQALDLAMERGEETGAIRAGLEGYRRGAPLPGNLPTRPPAAPSKR